MDRQKIGIVTGLNAEAHWLRGTGFMVEVGGGTHEGAKRAAEALIANGAEALISFGVAGGLSPALRPGAVLVPKAVIDGGQIFNCDYLLMEFLGGSTGKPIFAAMRVVETASDKTLLFQSKNADAVDLESGAVARAAAQRGIPFAVLRAVADPAESDLPPAVANAMTSDGRLNLPGVLGSVLRHPGQIKALMRLGQDAALARKALRTRVASLA
ncbi:MAG: hypothetical protein POH28_08685 [Acidocella sp.]|nr:hypothetical protein [Acidocella sp.]